MSSNQFSDSAVQGRMMVELSDVACDQCSAVVFYGIHYGAREAETYYQMVVGWLAELGLPPDKLSVHAPGHAGKFRRFSRSDAKLRHAGFAGVTYFGVISSTPGGKSGHDYLLKASFKGDVVDSYADVIARSSLATLTSTSLLPIAREMAELLKPGYGIGYTRSHDLGPEYYAIGINYGTVGIPTGEEYERQVTISRWCDMGMPKQVWQDGVVRDVYPWNFLTEPQLKRPIDGMPLEEWIKADRTRGNISHFCGDVLLWELKDSQIPRVRAALEKAGAIFDWRKYASSG